MKKMGEKIGEEARFVEIEGRVSLALEFEEVEQHRELVLEPVRLEAEFVGLETGGTEVGLEGLAFSLERHPVLHPRDSEREIFRLELEGECCETLALEEAVNLD